MKRRLRPVSLVLSRRGFGAIAFGALVLVACQSQGFGISPSSLGILDKNSALHVATQPAPSFSWQPYTTAYAINTVLTGISNNDNDEHFVGVSYPNSGSPFSSFIAHLTTPGPGSGSTPSPGPPMADPPGGSPSDVYIAALNDTIASSTQSYSVGYLPSGNGDRCGSAAVSVCGFIYDARHGKETELVDSKEGKNACAQTYLFGTMDANIQVGYYTTGNSNSTASCVPHAVEEYTYPSTACASPPCTQWIDFTFPASWNVTSSKAFGTNQQGHVVGTYSTATKSNIGWKLQDFAYTQLQYKLTAYSASGLPTEPLGIGFNMDVVGSYQDTAGKTHGFLYRGGNWAAENYNNNSSNQTVVYGFDDADTMVGGYLSGGVWKGFIAWCYSSCDNPPNASGRNSSTSQRRIGAAVNQRP